MLYKFNHLPAPCANKESFAELCDSALSTWSKKGQKAYCWDLH